MLKSPLQPPDPYKAHLGGGVKGDSKPDSTNLEVLRDTIIARMLLEHRRAHSY